jgi:uncharacterized damage-inducible protein DinB
MDAPHAHELLQYTRWANHRLANSLAQHPNALVADPNVLGLIGHVLSAEHIWSKRVAGALGPFDAWQLWQPADLPAAIDASSASWQALLVPNTGASLRDAIVTYHDLKGNAHSSSLAHIILHVTHHGTHHRAQVLTRLKLQGVQQVPALDFIAWSREQ